MEASTSSGAGTWPIAQKMSKPEKPILLDVSRLLWRAWKRRIPTGIDRTCRAYMAHFHETAKAVVQWKGVTRILDADASRQLFEVILEPESNDPAHLLGPMVKGLIGASRKADFAGQLYLNVGHTGLDKRAHTAWIEQSCTRPVYFVHDLIPITHPEYCRPGEPEKHVRRIEAIFANSIGVIGNSQHTLDEFAARRTMRPMPHMLVAPLGVTAVDRSARREKAVPVPARPYFVMLGTIEGRKNHLLILNIWADLARRLGPASPLLVVVGQRGWESEQACDMLDRSEAIRGHVIELPRCDDAHLAAYMANARALLFPSFAEGYGLPLVEALAAGTPVIASNLSVFRELANDIPDYLSPIDGLGWSRTIEDYAEENSPARAAQVARMTGWHPPQWSDHFRLVDEWLTQFSLAPQLAPAASG